jgi:hypothetical protein
MLRIDRLRQPGFVPRQLAVPPGLRKSLHDRRLSLLQLRELAGNVALRAAVRKSAGITESDLKRVLSTLDSLVPAGDSTLAVAPIQIPPLDGIVRPEQRTAALSDSGRPPIARFWKKRTNVLPGEFDHLDIFRYKPLIAQRGPDCVGHACRNAVELQLNICDRHFSGLFGWQYAMHEAGYPIPPRGTWPAVVLEGIVKRGICWDELYPEENYHEDRYIAPNARALADAERHKIDTFVNLRSLIGELDTVDLMCMLLYGSGSLHLKGRVLVIGVGVPEEWLLPESLVSGVRPIPLSDQPKAGHSLVLVGYFHHRGQRWFIGLENWGDKIGSRNPFGYPRNLGLCFIPAEFFRDPKWFWDLAISATHAEATVFSAAAATTAVPALAGSAFRAWTWRAQLALGAAAGSLGLLRLMFPGNWW